MYAYQPSQKKKKHRNPNDRTGQGLGNVLEAPLAP